MLNTSVRAAILTQIDENYVLQFVADLPVATALLFKRSALRVIWYDIWRAEKHWNSRHRGPTSILRHVSGQERPRFKKILKFPNFIEIQFGTATFQYSKLRKTTLGDHFLLDPLFSLNASPKESASHHTNKRKREDKEAENNDAARHWNSRQRGPTSIF